MLFACDRRCMAQFAAYPPARCQRSLGAAGSSRCCKSHRCLAMGATMIIHWQRHAVCLRSTLYGAVCCLPASALQVLGRTAWAFACVARFCAITAILIKTALCFLHRACSDARDAPFGPPAGAIRQIKVPANRQHTARCGTQRQAGTLQPRLEAASSDLLPFKCR
jgi:hypothetical protein